jgi:C-terminal processing protease CtpA/Prc
VAELTRGGASKLIVDIRRASGGSIDGGIALARLFVGNGTITSKETKGDQRQAITASAGDGSITLPTTLLIDTGTS